MKKRSKDRFKPNRNAARDERAAAAREGRVFEQPQTGRPTDYRPEFAVQCGKLASLGATDMEIADFFEVDVRTIYRWKHTHDAFCQSLQTGKEAATDRVERSLYQRATGYEHEAVKIFMPAGAKEPVYAKYREHVQASDGAIALWLTNQRSGKWARKAEITGKDGTPLNAAPNIIEVVFSDDPNAQSEM